MIKFDYSKDLTVGDFLDLIKPTVSDYGKLFPYKKEMLDKEYAICKEYASYQLSETDKFEIKSILNNDFTRRTKRVLTHQFINISRRIK